MGPQKEFKPQDLTDFLTSKETASWIANYLKGIRTKKSLTLERIAKRLPCEISELEMMEQGKFHFKSGRMHQLLSGYGQTLIDVLEKWAQECSPELSPGKPIFSKDRPFRRKAYYSVRLMDSNRHPKTPLFLGGDPKSFIWAIPLRRLKGDGTSIEFLELAERRSKDGKRGSTKPNAHKGTEIIYVVRGKIDQYVDTEGSGDYLHRTLSKGDLVHFDSSKPHYVENASEKSTALLLIIRFPE